MTEREAIVEAGARALEQGVPWASWKQQAAAALDAMLPLLFPADVSEEVIQASDDGFGDGYDGPGSDRNGHRYAARYVLAARREEVSA